MATLAEQLADAKSALHDIATGRAVKVVVDQNGERIEYAAANMDRLSAYIATLESKLGLGCGSGPMNVWM